MKSAKYSYILLLGLAVVGLIFLYGLKAHANPLFFVPTVQTATATTSPVYIVAGTSTSTLTYDTYTGGSTKASDKGVLLLQTIASSTSSVFTITLQYSQDGIDWYSDNLLATTTNTNVLSPNVYSFTAAGTATTSKAITVPMPTRFVRAVTSVAGANGGVWQQIVPQKQSN